MHFRILGPLEVEDGLKASGSAGTSSALSSPFCCCARTKWCRSTRSSRTFGLPSRPRARRRAFTR